MKQRNHHSAHSRYTLGVMLAGVGLFCAAATGPVWAQAGLNDNGGAARAGVGNQVTNTAPGADGEQGIPEGAPGDTQPIPQDEADPMQQAYKDYSQKKFSVAVPELQAIIKKSPNIAEAHEMLASIYAMQNQVPQAVPELEAVVRLQPKRADFRENLGKAYLQTGDTPKAAGVFQTLLTQYPSNAGYAYDYAIALDKEDKYAAAAAAFEKAAALNPKDSQLPLNAGLLYHQAGNDAKAVPELKSALALGTQDKFNAYSALADAANTAKQTDDAIGYYTQAAQAKPDDFGTEYNLGVLQQNSGKKADAEASYRKALALKAGDPQSYADAQENLAGLLKADGNLDEASALLTQAAQVDTRNAAIQIQLGAIYQKQGKKDLALAAYKQALAINPNSAIAKDGVAQTSTP